MNAPAAQPTLANRLTVLRILWGALTLSQLLYCFVAYFVPLQGEPNDLPALWGIGGVIAVLSVVLFRNRLSAGAIEEAFAQQSERVAMDRLFVSFVICWALNESVTLFGFVRAFAFTKSAPAMLPFLAAGLILNFLMFPRLDEAHRRAAYLPR